jgi:hypothetical protein
LFGLMLPFPGDRIMWTAIVVVLLVSRTWFAAGTWSMGTFFRRRLRWAFASEPAASPPWRRHVDLDDRASLTDEGHRVGKLAGTNAELVICCAGNIRGYDRAAAGRHAVSFTASRSWIGGPELGWMRTPSYVDKLSSNRRDDLTIAALTAVSGAAVSPAMGKSSLGPIGAVLAVLNVRLGGWLPHPAAVAATPTGAVWKHTPGWPYFLRETLLRYRHECPYVYVSDGGHWENLGLVEALRRGCNQIIAISAAGDGAYSNATLAQAIEIARTDLRIDIELDDVWTMRPLAGDPPDTATAPPDTATGRQYLYQRGDDPIVARFARNGHAFGTFTRRGVGPPNDKGIILLIEASMIDGMPVDVHAYAESHHEFPDVSTGDQLFSNADFEAYRKLGEVLTLEALASPHAAPMLTGR